MKTFTITRTDFGVDVIPSLPLYLNECNHSPCGFEFGYCGSGPHQLAYALLRNVTGHKGTAIRLYGHFVREVISNQGNTTWTITERQILKWISSLTHKQLIESRA